MSTFAVVRLWQHLKFRNNQNWVRELWAWCRLAARGSAVRMNAEKIDVVLSFPLPPKQFYEHLSVEEIKLAQPPSLPENTDTFSPFGLARVSVS